MQPLDKSILEALGVRTIQNIPYPSELHLHDLGFLNGFSLYHRNYYYVLYGKFPYLDAKKLYESGITTEKGIREAGHGYGAGPYSWVTSDEWESKSSALIKQWLNLPDAGDKLDYKKLGQEAQEMKDDLMKKDPDSFYLQCYHIDTEDGLMYMIRYIKDNHIHTDWNSYLGEEK